MLYDSLRSYINGNEISLALIAEFFDQYALTVHKLGAGSKPEVATVIDGVVGTILPVKKEVLGLRCWKREQAVANALEKLRAEFCASGYTNAMVYDNQKIIEHNVGELVAYQAHLTVYLFRWAEEEKRTKAYRLS